MKLKHIIPPVFTLLLLLSATSAAAQLSKGKGELVYLGNKQFKCYLPEHFVVTEKPIGVTHTASGTIVTVVKVPSDKNITLFTGIPHSVFEDERYTITDLKEEDIIRHHIRKGRLYYMSYTLEGYEFERYTLLLSHGEDHYLVVANYLVRLKNQVHDEVEKILASFIIL